VKLKDDEKLRAIAEATFTLVEQTGLSGLTMASIAREAGLGGVLGRHFALVVFLGRDFEFAGSPRDPETGELLGEDALEAGEFQSDFFEGSDDRA